MTGVSIAEGINEALAGNPLGAGFHFVLAGLEEFGTISSGKKTANLIEDARASSMLHSIEDAANFERSHFGGRVVNEEQLVKLQMGLEERFTARGLEFEGIFLNGPPVNRFIPKFNAQGKLLGGRIELIGVSERQPLIRVLDEVSHAMDASEPGFIAMLKRFEKMATARRDESVRLISHSELFHRTASRLEADDPVLRIILEQEDVSLLRQLAQELIR